MVKISPSILAADFDNLEKEVKDVMSLGADRIHVDVMDGRFVNNITPGKEMYEKARAATDGIIETHLMVENPREWILDFKKSDIIIFHVETVNIEECFELIDYIHSLGIKVGITLKPDTPLKKIMPFLEKVDMVLVMTVEPGFGGQKLIGMCLDKVNELRLLNDKIDIEVDGGINLDTFQDAVKAGANILVAGTAIFKATNRKKVISLFKE